MKVKVNQNSTTRVISVGVQGPAGIPSVSQAPDVDITDLKDGSVLVYSTINNKWNSTTLFENQTMECGQY